MRSLLLCAALLGIAAVLLATAALADGEQLVVTQDESSMERTIEAYLKAHYADPVKEKMAGEGDLALIVTVGKEGKTFDVVVDTQASNKDHDGKVLERPVSMQIYTGVKVPAEKQAAVLRAISEYAKGQWFCSAYIDEDNEVSCQWCVNVMAQGLHTEYVADTVSRLKNSWEKLRPRVMEALQ